MAITHLAIWSLLVSPWFVRSRSIHDPGYLGILLRVNPYAPDSGSLDAVGLLARIVSNASRYLTTEPIHALFNYVPLFTRGWEGAIGLAVVAVSVLGILKLTHSRVLIGGYLLVTLAVLVSWPEVWSGPRFLLPAVPFLVLGFCSGIFHLLQRVWAIMLPEREFHPLWMLVLLFWLWPHLHHVHSLQYTDYPKRWSDYVEMAKWTRANIEPTQLSAVESLFCSIYSQIAW